MCCSIGSKMLQGRGGGGYRGCLTELCRTKALWYLLYNGCYKRPLFSRFSGHFLPLRTGWVFNFIVSITHNSHHFPRPNLALLSHSLSETGLGKKPPTGSLSSSRLMLTQRSVRRAQDPSTRAEKV